MRLRNSRKRAPDDALHPSQIAKTAPDMKQAYLDAEKLSTFADHTQRTGAGGTRSDLPGLRLLGRKETAEFHELFTETGKHKPQEQPVLQNPREFIGKPTEQPKGKVVALPTNYCPDCDTAGLMVGSLSISPVMEPWPALGLKPGDIIRHAVCRKCHEQAKLDASLKTYVYDSRFGQVPAAVIKGFERMARMTQNVQAFVKAMWSSQRENVFYNEYGEDMTKHGS